MAASLIAFLGTTGRAATTRYQFFDNTGALISSPISAGIFETPGSRGIYAVSAPTFPANAIGVSWTDTGDATIYAQELFDFRFPNIETGVAGAVITAGTGTAQLSVTSGVAAADAVQISGDSVAADRLEAILDGTGGPVAITTLDILTDFTTQDINIGAGGIVNSGVTTLTGTVTATDAANDIRGVSAALTAVAYQEIAQIIYPYDDIYFVRKDGNDANSGLSPSAAKLTIAGAIAVRGSGDLTIVSPGTYSERPTMEDRRDYLFNPHAIVSYFVGAGSDRSMFTDGAAAMTVNILGKGEFINTSAGSVIGPVYAAVLRVSNASSVVHIEGQLAQTTLGSSYVFHQTNGTVTGKVTLATSAGSAAPVAYLEAGYQDIAFIRGNSTLYDIAWLNGTGTQRVRTLYSFAGDNSAEQTGSGAQRFEAVHAQSTGTGIVGSDGLQVADVDKLTTGVTSIQQVGAGVQTVFVGSYNGALVDAAAGQQRVTLKFVCDSPGSGAYPITVTITDGTDPIQNVFIGLYDSGVEVATGVSDASGNATFSLNAGTYEVVLVKGGYQFTPTNRTVTGSQAGTLVNDLAMTAISPITPPVNPAMCAIGGYMIDPEGNPAVNAEVSFTLNGPNGRRPTTSGGNIINFISVTAITDGAGYFEQDVIRTDALDQSGYTYTIRCESAQFNVTTPVAASTIDVADL